MNVSQWKSEYDRHGFVVIREFLSGDKLRELQDHLDRYVRDVAPHVAAGDAFFEDRKRPETLRQMHRLEQDPFFRAYLTNPDWHVIAIGLLGEPIQPLQGAEWFNKPPGTHHCTPPHQDNFYFCLDPPQVLTMWLALDTIDTENGCLRYVRGSHRGGLRPHSTSAILGFSQTVDVYSDEDRAREVAIVAQPGDLLVHHGNTIHRADANQSSTRQRRSFAMVVRGQSCRRDERAFARYQQSAHVQQETLGQKK